MTRAPFPGEVRELLRASRTIAVVGLSPKRERPSNAVARYLQHSGYRVIPVNPGHREILGERCYPSLTAASSAAKDSIDIVDVFRRSEFAGSVVDEAIGIRPRLIWLQLGVIDAAAAGRATEAGIPIVMDQCLAVEHSRLV